LGPIRALADRAGKRGGPTIQEVIEKENELIDFIIAKLLPDFSLDVC
jgi:hypothetical protein